MKKVVLRLRLPENPGGQLHFASSPLTNLTLQDAYLWHTSWPHLTPLPGLSSSIGSFTSKGVTTTTVLLSLATTKSVSKSSAVEPRVKRTADLYLKGMHK